VPPFEIYTIEERSLDVLLAVAQEVDAFCVALVIFRAKRITPAGWMRLSREARRGDISVPSKPMIRSWPDCMAGRKITVIGHRVRGQPHGSSYNSNLNAPRIQARAM